MESNRITLGSNEITLASFTEELHSISKNVSITNYFIENNKSILDFITDYIQIDTILKQRGNINSNDLLNKICNLENNMQIIHSKISSYQDIQNLQLQTIQNKIQHISDHDIRKNLSEFYSNLDINNKNHLTTLLDSFNDKIQNLNQRSINDLDKRIIDTIASLNTNVINSIQNHSQINRIQETLMLLNNNFTNNSSRKGAMTEQILYKNLLSAFPDSEIINSSNTPHAGDIQIKKDGRPDILIDSKHFESTNVPKCDLEKFQSDCKINNCSGILACSFSGIANKKHFEIDIVDGRIYVYISNHQFDTTLFQLAVRIIYGIHSIIKEHKTDNIMLERQLFERLKVEFTYFNQTLQTHLDAIKTSINSISQLSLTQLDNFFKRSNFSNELKKFSCTFCSTGFSSAKAMTKHMKLKHDFQITTTRKTRTKKNEERNENNHEQTDENTEENTDGIANLNNNNYHADQELIDISEHISTDNTFNQISI